MAIPSYQDFMYHFLEVLKDGKEHRLRDIYRELAEYFNLTEEEKQKTLPSGKQLVYQSRISWARTYLAKAGLIDVVKRGTFKISDEGLKVLSDPNITKIDKKFLMRYEGFNKFINKSTDEKEYNTRQLQIEKHETPHEIIEKNYNLLKKELQDELLDKISECSPEFFERLIVELIVAIGYGGSVEDAGQAVGQTGDEGIDGIIKEDVLGLEMIYLQAKRWAKDRTVSRPDIQTFVGSLVGKQASKGIFITTAKFSKYAYDYVKSIDKRVILIDGERLTDLMFKYDVGVTHEQVFITKKIDLDFFDEIV